MGERTGTPGFIGSMVETGKYRPKSLTYTKNLSGGSRERLREAILYVSERCEKAKRFGMIKLNKIIWRADFRAFQARHLPITGAGYHKLKLGPAPIEMRPVLEEMRAKREIEIESVDVDSKSEKRVIAILPSNVNFFNADDLKYFEEAIEYYWDKTGTEASDDSHGVAWKTRAEKEKIPYEAVFLNDDQLKGDLEKRFAKMAHEKRWISQ
jgi:hypothetical protein